MLYFLQKLVLVVIIDTLIIKGILLRNPKIINTKKVQYENTIDVNKHYMFNLLLVLISIIHVLYTILFVGGTLSRTCQSCHSSAEIFLALNQNRYSEISKCLDKVEIFIHIIEFSNIKAR